MSRVLRNTDLFKTLSEGTVRRYSKKQSIPTSHQNGFFYTIAEGYIKRYQVTNEGTESIQAIHGPGDAFPLRNLYDYMFQMNVSSLDGEPFYEAHTDTKLYAWNQTEFMDLVEKNPKLLKDLHLIADYQLQSHNQLLENMNRRVANRRIAHQLAHYAEVFGADEGDNVKTIDLPLTHQLLGSILDLARETVTMNMNRLQERGLISVNKKRITIHDYEALKKAAF